MSKCCAFFGLLLLVNITLISGVFKVIDPAPQAQFMLSKSFPKILKLAGLPPLTTELAVHLIQATGAIMAALSLFILLNVYRGASAFLLALGLIGITVSMHIDVSNPAAIDQHDQIHVLKNLSIIGGLFYVAGQSCGACKSSTKTTTSPKGAKDGKVKGN